MTKQRARSAAPRQDSDGSWSFVVDGGPGKNAKGEWKDRRQVRRKGFRTKALAQEALDEVRGKERASDYVAPSKQILKAYLESWLDGLTLTGQRSSTINSYGRRLDPVIDALGHRRLDQVTASDLDSLYATLLTSGRRVKPYGPLSKRTVRLTHVVLSSAFKDAVRKGTLARNPAEMASPPSAKSTAAPEQAWWTPAETKQFLDLTQGDPLWPMWRLLAMSGLRRGEACGLRWSDVDTEAGQLTVNAQLTVVRSPGAPDLGLVYSEAPKTAGGRRVVDLDPVTVVVLKTERKHQKENRILLGAGFSNQRNLVFTDATGAPIHPDRVSKIFAQRITDHGLRKVRLHDLRHGHAGHLLAAGMDPLLISKRLGHSSVAFTLQTYGHLLPGAGASAASAVAALVDNAGEL
jgi:integrase